MVFMQVNMPVPFVSIMGYWSFHVFVQSHEPLEGCFPRKLEHTPVSHTPPVRRTMKGIPAYSPLVKAFWVCSKGVLKQSYKVFAL